MAFRIIRNDITKMETDAIVNTAGETPQVGEGCDIAVYTAAGYAELHALRSEIGDVPPGEVFITPGFNLPAKYIIHAVSPLYVDGRSGEEEKLRSCYRKSLHLAKENGIRSIAFPLVSTGAYGYPREEGIRIAVDEFNDFLLKNDMDITLVVFDDKSRQLSSRVYPDLEEYIDRHYVRKKAEEEYGGASNKGFRSTGRARSSKFSAADMALSMPLRDDLVGSAAIFEAEEIDEDALGEAISERLRHTEDPFGVYLLYLIQSKGKTNSEVYNKAIISKQSFAKLKKDPVKYHPDKITALQYCVGAELNIDETRDLLARAGYALSPSDRRDIIFSYFITHEYFDMLEIDIKLEEHGIPCIIR